MTDIKVKEKNAAQFWERQASRSEIVACVKEIAQFWEREASRSEIVACVTELVNQNNRLIDKVKQLTSMRDGLWSRLENLVAETRGVGEDEDPESEFATMVASKSQTVEETVGSADGLTTPAPPLDDSPLFDGEIEMAMAPPVDMAQLIRLRRNLDNFPYLKILRTYGHRNSGAAITILINEPLPLIKILTEMSEVEKVEPCADGEATDTDSPWELAPEVGPVSRKTKKFLVTLNFSEVRQHD